MELLKPWWCSANISQETLGDWAGLYTVYNGLQCLLKLLMCLLKIAVPVGSPQGTAVHQLQCNLHGNAVISRHEVPVLLNVL